MITYSNSESNVNIPRPWIRLFAKAIDVYIYLILAGLIIFLTTYICAYLFPIALLVCLAVDAFFISAFSTTPGKWLFSTYVTDSKGKKLPFKIALKRTFLCFVKGLGLCIPFISIFTFIFSYSDLKRNKISDWDLKCKSQVVTKEIKWYKIIIIPILLVLLFLYSLFSVLYS